MPVYLVKPANQHGTYTSGRYYAESPAEAEQMAREDYDETLAGVTMEYEAWLCELGERDNPTPRARLVRKALTATIWLEITRANAVSGLVAEGEGLLE